MIDPDDNGPPIDEDLRGMLFPEVPAAEQVAVDVPPGKCPIHGNVGFGRFMMIANGELVSDHCLHCLSRVFTALVGVLEMPE